MKPKCKNCKLINTQACGVDYWSPTAPKYADIVSPIPCSNFEPNKLTLVRAFDTFMRMFAHSRTLSEERFNKEIDRAFRLFTDGKLTIQYDTELQTLVFTDLRGING